MLHCSEIILPLSFFYQKKNLHLSFATDGGVQTQRKSYQIMAHSILGESIAKNKLVDDCNELINSIRLGPCTSYSFEISNFNMAD